MKIVLTGSIGHISQPLAEQLIREGHSVTIISSNEERKTAIEAIGAKAAIGSIDDLSFLKDQFSNADAVYCMTPPNFREPDQLSYYERVANNYAAAISLSGVKRVIYLSSYGAHLSSGTGFITGSYRGEQILNAVDGISLTHIRPSFFYYNLFAFIPMIKAAGFIGAVYGDEDKLAMVSPKDIALAIAEEITKKEHPQPIRYVSSDDRTCKEVAAILGKAIGKPELQWKTLPAEQVSQSLKQRGMPDNAVANMVELGIALHEGRLREELEKQAITKGLISIEDFAVEFKREFEK